MAQNVYSLNVVGYVQATIPPGFSPICNPLDANMGAGEAAGSNTLANLFAGQGIPNSSSVSTFNPANNQYTVVAAYSTRGAGSWSGTPGGTFDMPVGLGVFFHNLATTNAVVTYVGQVVQGTYHVTTLAGPSKFNFAGSPVPFSGDVSNLTSICGLVPGNNDAVETYNSAINQWSLVASWSTRGKVWNTALNIKPGQAFFYHNLNAANAWTSNFTVQ